MIKNITLILICYMCIYGFSNKASAEEECTRENVNKAEDLINDLQKDSLDRRRERKKLLGDLRKLKWAEAGGVTVMVGGAIGFMIAGPPGAIAAAAFVSLGGGITAATAADERLQGETDAGELSGVIRGISQRALNTARWVTNCNEQLRNERGGVSGGNDEEEHDDHPNSLGGSDGDDRIGGGSNCMLCGSLDIPEEIVTVDDGVSDEELCRVYGVNC